MNIGWQEILLILLLVLVLFGAKKLPGLARSLGKSMREFKKGVKDIKDDINIDGDEKEKHE